MCSSELEVVIFCEYKSTSVLVNESGTWLQNLGSTFDYVDSEQSDKHG